MVISISSEPLLPIFSGEDEALPSWEHYEDLVMGIKCAVIGISCLAACFPFCAVWFSGLLDFPHCCDPVRCPDSLDL